jgi:hypothetical protein
VNATKSLFELTQPILLSPTTGVVALVVFGAGEQPVAHAKTPVGSPEIQKMSAKMSAFILADS